MSSRLLWLVGCFVGALSTGFTSTAFESGKEGYHTYRIPALARLPSCDLLLFVEGRKFSGADHGWNDVVMKRSKDEGRTWGKLELVYSESNREHNITIGNPAPIVAIQPASHTGAAACHVLLVFTRDNKAVLQMRSTDCTASSWDKPTELKEAVRAGWTWVATGPPQGLQLSSGRLVVCADHHTGTVASWGSHSMFSDDLGATWELSAALPGGNECQIATAPNGTLIMNMRTVGARQFSWSHDQGKTWSSPISSNFNGGHPYAGGTCEGSTVHLPNSHLLAFSTPFAPSSRTNLTVFVSSDSGASWKSHTVVEPSYSAYSALYPYNATHTGLAYEQGQGYTAIRFAALRLA